jgi:hypothetical protein
VADPLNRLTRRERIALTVVLEGAVSRMAHAATRLLDDYRDRGRLDEYGQMIGEASDLIRELAEMRFPVSR